MWKLLKLIGWLLKTTLVLALLLFFGAILCLYFAERGLPDAVVQKIAERLSSDELVCRIDRVTYSLRHGLTVHRVKAFPKRVTEGAMISAEEINVDFTLLSLAPLHDRMKRITVKGFGYPSLPPRPPRDPDAPKPPVVPREINVTLPDIAPFELILERSNILGLQTERVTATVSSSAAQATATNVRIAWPQQLGDLGVVGNATFDVDTKRIIAHVKGQTFPNLITPFLTELRAQGVVKQLDFFRDFKKPIALDYSLDIELTRVDYTMNIDVGVQDCTYHGVPVHQAKATVIVTDTNNLVIADIAIPSSELRSGSVTGRLRYKDDDDSLTIDAQGALSKEDLLAVINVLNNGELDVIQCETPVAVRAKGVLETNLRKQSATNDLNATLTFAKGSILRIPLMDVSCDLHMYAHSACVDNIKGAPVDGGKLEGQVHFAFPAYSASNTTFVAKITADRASFSNLMCIAQPTNTLTGDVTGSVTLIGLASENVLPTLEGQGSMKVDNSMLTQMPLFAGLTAWLARNIPGISSVVNQSSAKLDFTITNGVAVTKNMVVEGNVFSILCRGSHTLETDVVDMNVRVNILKEHTIAGQILRVITFPITRVLLEFKLTGTSANPELAYITFVEKLIDTIF